MSETLPAGYRLTELGPLPEEWRVVRLGEVAILRIDTILPTEAPNAKYVGLEHLDPGEALIRRHGVAGETISAKAVFKPGDILYGKLRPYLDKAAIAEWEGVCSTDILVLVGKPNNVDSYFLAYLMHSTLILSHAIATTTGVNHPRTSWKALSQAVIPLPPLAEQRAIAHVLRTVQEAKEATARVIAATRELKKSLMRHLFTCGPVPADQTDQVPMQETELGPIPAHWRVVRLGEVVEDSFSGGTPPTQRPEYWNGNIPWTTSAIIGDDDVILSRFQRTITELGLKHSASKIAPKGSLMVGTRVGVGKVVVPEFDIAMSQDLTALLLKPCADALLMAYLFKYAPLQRQIQERTRGTTIKGIPRKDLLTLTIPLPPLAEQQEIARILQAVDEKIRAEEARKVALEGLFRSLLHHLMTAQVRLPRAFTQQFAGGDDAAV
ncbi:MAG: restriction endonuclease subunit S [Anaerolineae bacterium]